MGNANDVEVLILKELKNIRSDMLDEIKNMRNDMLDFKVEMKQDITDLKQKFEKLDKKTDVLQDELMRNREEHSLIYMEIKRMQNGSLAIQN